MSHPVNININIDPDTVKLILELLIRHSPDLIREVIMSVVGDALVELGHSIAEVDKKIDDGFARIESQLGDSAADVATVHDLAAQVQAIGDKADAKGQAPVPNP